ncbi:glycosyltransferase [Chryseobacterium sp. T1]
MKNIVFVIESLHLGGAEKSLVTLLQNLDYTKYSVDLITFQEGVFFKDSLPSQINHIVVSLPQISYLDRLQYWISRKLKNDIHNAQLFWYVIYKYCKAINKHYDIAIAYNQGLATYFVGDFISSDKKYAWVNTDYIIAGYQMDLDFPVYEKFDKVIAVSPETKKSIENALASIHKTLEIDIIKDISDDSIIKAKAALPLEINFNKDIINIVSVGRLVAPKGFDLAIEACKILIDKQYNVNWYIIGEGGERANLEKLIDDKNLNKYFFLLGGSTNPYPYMRACDIYVQTSLFEGLGLTVIEASILQKPIVCTHFPTAFGILEHEKTGLIAEMNPISIASQVERLIRDEELKNSLINNLSQVENNDKEESLKKINKLFI